MEFILLSSISAVPADLTPTCYMDRSCRGLSFGAILALSVLLSGCGINVPSVIGRKLPVAEERLQRAGLKWVTRSEQVVDAPSGEVISQDPKAGTSVRKDSVISLVVAEGTFSKVYLGPAAPKPPTKPTTLQVIFDNDFDQWAPGTYTSAMVNADWDIPDWTIGIKEGRATIVGGSLAHKGQALQVTMPAGKFGTESGIFFRAELGDSYDEVIYSYYVKYADNFSFNLKSNGGKVLGLAGGEDAGGGDPANGYDGWSARQTWGKGGVPQQYVYHVDQPSNYGQPFAYRESIFKPGTWYKVETRVVMNTPGKNDGIIQSTLDGVLVLDKRDFNFRETGAFAIDTLLFYTFMGGNTISFAPLKTTYIILDEIVVKAKPSDPVTVTPSP